MAPRCVDGLLLDLDGTVYVEDEPVPGAAEALTALRRAGVPFRFVTNTSRWTRNDLVERLAGMGIDVSAGECLPAAAAAAVWLRRRGVRRVAPRLVEATRAELAAELEVDEDTPEVVVVGDLGDGWTFDVLNRTFRQLMAGARLLAVHRNRYWRTADGLTLDAGAFIAALEYASGVEAELVGKPSPEFFEAALAELGLPPERVAMVGDDLECDVVGAQRVGVRGIAVLSGKLRDRCELGGVRPDGVLESIAELPSWLGL